MISSDSFFIPFPNFNKQQHEDDESNHQFRFHQYKKFIHIILFIYNCSYFPANFLHDYFRSRAYQIIQPERRNTNGNNSNNQNNRSQFFIPGCIF